jgi:hypothetical protein
MSRCLEIWRRAIWTYEPGNYERAFTLSGAVDPPGIEEGA